MLLARPQTALKVPFRSTDRQDDQEDDEQESHRPRTPAAHRRLGQEEDGLAKVRSLSHFCWNLGRELLRLGSSGGRAHALASGLPRATPY